MKKVLGGHVYDTSKAKKLGSFEASCGCSDFHYYEEELYRTKSGYYFLYGTGNAASPYARQVETNTWSSGEKILPLTEKEAKEWAEDHLDGDEYETIFGAVDSGTTGILLNIPDQLLEKVDSLRSQENKSRTEFIIELIRKAVK